MLALFGCAAFAQRGPGTGGGGGRGHGMGNGMGHGRGDGMGGGHRGGGAPAAAPSAAPSAAGGNAGAVGAHGGGYGGRGGGWQQGGVGHGPAGQQVRPPGAYSYPQNIYGSVSGFGNVVYPGTGHAPGTYSPFSIVDPTFGTRLTNTVSGFGYPYNTGYGYGYGYRRYNRGTTTVVLPYPFPVYAPYPEPYPYPYAEPQPAPAPQIIYVVPGNTMEAPRGGVVTYVVPPHRNEGTEPATAPPAKRLYLIALKNQSIYSTTEYWVEDDTLHYLTSYGAHNQVSLDQVDLDFTVRLNRERGVDFRLER